MSNDTRLQQAVLAELTWDPSVVAAHIGVIARDGIVTLTGHVEHYAEKAAARKAAGRVKGVRAVAEEMEVRLPFEHRRDDSDIAAAAADRLAWDASVPRESIKVVVEKGWVTLSGETDWHFQKEAAVQDVQHLFGVVGVSDQIVIRPKVDASHLSSDITHALHRSWLLHNNTVSVSADGGHVRLSGTVESPYDREIALLTAWAAPGTVSVENNIFVS